MSRSLSTKKQRLDFITEGWGKDYAKLVARQAEGPNSERFWKVVENLDKFVEKYQAKTSDMEKLQPVLANIVRAFDRTSVGLGIAAEPGLSPGYRIFIVGEGRSRETLVKGSPEDLDLVLGLWRNPAAKN